MTNKLFKGFVFLFVGLFAFLLVGCKKEEDPNKGKTPYQIEWEAYVNSIIPSVYEESQKLPKEYAFDGCEDYVEIEWESSNEKSINKRGTLLGNIFGSDVTLTSKVYINGELQFTYAKQTYAPGEMKQEDYIKQFNEIYIPDESYSSLNLSTVENVIFKDRKIVGTVTYTSSDTTVIDNDGKYVLKNEADVRITISYAVTINDFTLNGSKEVLIHGNQNAMRVQHAKDWLQNEWYSDERISSDINLPTTDDKGIVTLEFDSLSKNYIDNTGAIVCLPVDAELKFNVKIIMNDVSETVEVILHTLSKDDAVNYILDRMYDAEVTQSYFRTYVISTGYDNSDYGYLNFYYQDISENDIITNEYTYLNYTYGKNTSNTNVSNLKINKGMADMEKMAIKRPYITKNSTEFVCVHDTGDNVHTAAAWANEVQTSNREVSWHFTVDDTSIYQQIPTSEVAYHAGDGSRQYQLTDTGVKYTTKNPTIKVGDDGYFYINNQKSLCKAPTSNGLVQTAITPAGLFTTYGKNGNYYINNYYYNETYRVISNAGGNRNSVGIETCIVDGMSYSQVMRNTANLVVHLLNIYGLDTTRVLYHRSFSGKLCPMSMYRAKEGTMFTIDAFKKLVETEYFIMKYLPNVKFTYKSHNTDILDNQGHILKYVSSKTEVTYDVTVEFEGKTYTKTYTTVINPKA